MKILNRIRFLFMAVFIAAIFFACTGKDVTAPTNYFISSTNNGIHTVNSLQPLAKLNIFQLGQTSCSLLALSDTVSIGIYVNTQTAIDTSTIYTDTSINNNASLILINKTHELASINLVNSNVKVSFTKITSASVEGNFSGNVATMQGDTTTSIINGAFYLPVK